MAGSDRQTVTIYDVAARAGVSIATVSRALRGSPQVAQGTRERVLTAVEDLKFRPNRVGQSLAEGQHAANGIVFPDLSGPYYAEVVLGYEEVAAELGRSVLILATQGRSDATRRVLDLADRVDGMAIMGRTVPDEVVSQITRTGLPVVLLARPPVAGLDSITSDNRRSGRALAEHLLSHGLRRPVYLGSPDHSPDIAQRHDAFLAALRAAGLPPPADPIRCTFDVQAGHATGLSVLAGRDRPDALVCANDEVALGAIAAAEELGMSVPDDIAITGWDDVMASRYARLTTVRQPMRELGATAARWLQERISGTDAVARRKTLRTELVIRSTCGTHDDTA